jgi:ABC-type branched-subunit amino acid transport system ATPase component
MSSNPKNISPTALLKSIASWKINAANEDMRKYFFQFHEFDRIAKGEIAIVLGRKGVGKTALCEYLHATTSDKRKTIVLSFKDFMFKEMYSLGENTKARNSQYVNVWKLIILSATCWLMSKDSLVDYKTRRSLQTTSRTTPPRHFQER